MFKAMRKTDLQDDLPRLLYSAVFGSSGRIRRLILRWHLARLKKRVRSYEPNRLVRFLDYTLRITDGPNFYIQLKDEFVRRIYHFETVRPQPLIIDGGSNMGVSILYFKHVYPDSRVIGFEPDPAVFRILRENVDRNHLQGVTLIKAGLGKAKGRATFMTDGSAGGHLEEGGKGITVEVERLSDYLDETVDFLKLNIEGEELAVLQEVEESGKLGNLRELVIEYHGWSNRKQELGPLLELLDRQGFRYLLHDFDHETCGASKPPFQLELDTNWFCLIYARRVIDSFRAG
jgi:FkbM family methyltransferase